MLPQDLERVAQERIISWEKEVQHRQLLEQIPNKPPIWRHWRGHALVWAGALLMQLGERLVRRGRRESISLAS
jgi:hypothetical protein